MGNGVRKGICQEIWFLFQDRSRTTKHGFTRSNRSTLFYRRNSSQDKDVLWNYIVRDLERKYVLVCCANASDTDENIVNNHAYSMLSTHSFENNGDNVRLLKIRNPWGYKEWAGAWSDDSSEWKDMDAELRESILQGYQFKDDGIFFIYFDDFLANYVGIFVCQVNDDYQFSSIKHTQDNKHGQMLTFTIDQPGHYTLQVHQKDKRYTPKSEQENHKYSIIQMVVGKQSYVGTEERFTFKESAYGYDREICSGSAKSWTEYEDSNNFYEAGTYQIWVKAQWRDGNTNDWAMSAYGPSEVIFNKVKVDKHKFLDQVYLDLASQKRMTQFCGEVKLVYEKLGGIIYLGFFNNNENQGLSWTINFKNMDDDFKLNPPHKDGKAYMVVPAGEQAICMIHHKEFETNYDLSWDDFQYI